MAHLQLQNHRSALEDAQCALELQPKADLRMKLLYRASKAAFGSSRLPLARQYVDVSAQLSCCLMHACVCVVRAPHLARYWQEGKCDCGMACAFGVCKPHNAICSFADETHSRRREAGRR